MPLPARWIDLQVIEVLRYDFTFNNAGLNSGNANTTAAVAAAALNAGINIGTLPQGAIPIQCNCYVDVAFNNGTNNLFSVGLTATGTDLVNGGSLASKAAVITAVPIAAIATSKATTDQQNTPIYLSTSQTGTAATTGQATVQITYYR